MSLLDVIDKKFPRLVIKTGDSPLGKTATVEVDGVAPSNLQRLELDLDVNDAVRVRLYEVVNVEVDVAVPSTPKRAYLARVKLPELSKDRGEVVIKRWEVIAEGRGATLRDAVLAAANRIPANAEPGSIAGPARRHG